MSERIKVHLDEVPIYDIVLETSFDHLNRELDRLSVSGKKICIVTDTNVAPLYLDEVRHITESFNCRTLSHIIPAGEEYKTLETVRGIYEALICAAFDRNDLLIALGGGVIGDLCGFAAATYLRGIDFIQLPTTLLSQVDSSIGGKTGVDFDSYKNMVGAFHMPRLVYSNTAALMTLMPEQFASGMGEVIKHGLIKDAGYYQWLISHAKEIQNKDLAVCQEMIIKSNYIKRDVVERDPKEKGERALLNLGHTLGHAIEKEMDFKLLHGHCVGIGCLAAAHISAVRGLISHEETVHLKEVLELFHIPVLLTGLDAEKILELTKKDKKMDSGVIKFILLKNIGNAYVDKSLSKEELLGGLSFIFQ